MLCRVVLRRKRCRSCRLVGRVQERARPASSSPRTRSSSPGIRCLRPAAATSHGAGPDGRGAATQPWSSTTPATDGQRLELEAAQLRVAGQSQLGRHRLGCRSLEQLDGNGLGLDLAFGQAGLERCPSHRPEPLRQRKAADQANGSADQGPRDQFRCRRTSRMRLAHS